MSTLYEAPSAPLPPPAKKSRKWMWIAGAVVGAVALISVGSASGKASVQQAAAPAPVTVTAAAPPAITVTAEAPAPVTVTAAAPPAADPVTVTAAAPPAVTVTAPAAPAAPASAASADPSGPKRNGSYIIGSQIAPGNWQCTTPGSGSLGASWTTYNSSHALMDIDLTSIAAISDSAYSVTFDFCASTWTLVG